MDGATAIIALSTVISYVKNCTKNSYCVLFRKNEGLSFSRAQIQFFFLDCQDDNSIFSLDRLFYTRVSSHMCHPDTFRITGHYSTLSALFFAAQNSLSFLFLQSEILRESIHVTNAVHFPETSETNQTEEEKLQSFRSIRTKQGTNEENMKNC